MSGGRPDSKSAARDEPEEFGIDFTPESLKAMNRHFRLWANSAKVPFRLYGRRMKAAGTENLRPDGALIVAPMHMSLMDPVLTGLSLFDLGRMPHFLAKSTLFKGALGIPLKGMGQIPVLRNSAQAVESLVFAKRALAAGQTVVIYPRGTLTTDPDGWPDPSRTGAARLSLETGVPIVPAAHWGLQDVLRKKSKRAVPQPGRKLSVLYGRRIDPADFTSDNAGIVALTHRITNDTAALLAQLKGEPVPERFRTAGDPGQ